MMQIALTPAEIVQAALVGVMRQAANLRDGRRDANNAPLILGWQFHVEGALGECAVAKALGLYWPGMGRLRHADVGTLQVRTAASATDRLILHPGDDDAAVFIHVTGINGSYTLHGWLYGRDGKRREWWADPRGGRPAFFVPVTALQPIETLGG